MVKAIKAMYTVVRASIKYNGVVHNDVINSHQGVKQGDPSSSLLFMMFVNDLMSNINADLDGIFTLNELSLFLILYADDQVLFATNPDTLQSMLKDIEIYCNTFGLKINIDKTKVMIFERGRPTHFDFHLYGKKLEIVTSFKYLGIYLFKNENWSRTQKSIAEHASKALYRLFAILHQYEFKTSEKCKLFVSLVASILNYCSEVWEHMKILRVVILKRSTLNFAEKS